MGILEVLVHVVGDALNNVDVIIATLVIWLAKPDSRFYANLEVSLAIALMIIASSLSLGIVAS